MLKHISAIGNTSQDAIRRAEDAINELIDSLPAQSIQIVSIALEGVGVHSCHIFYFQRVPLVITFEGGGTSETIELP